MAEYNELKKPSSWLGFHRDGLIMVLFLDLLWTIIEIGTTATVVGIPAIPFIAFVMFGLTYWLVYKKQRKLGNSMKMAMVRAFFLGVVAGLPFSVTYWLMVFVFAILNQVLPKSQGVSVKLPSNEQFNLGKFAIEFKEVEHLLKLAIEQAGKIPSSKVVDNIEFLRARREIPVELANSLDQLREVRNHVTHEVGINPNAENLRLLKKLQDELRAIVKE
ncbi:hypothetical protein [Oscillatoria sp. FACHB-1406]|uniref:DUF4145 domain-containing protein n=1 Tax=Oscillatoria sp. FACHB-1406 TaxID=2692846 RepID=UPI001684B188|nr:hypothetical protein [Oscillatoria sp. FACHB-1406]MBD2579925.1 hypothetical protein [Oscillatoria sp. FACHB-1406]